MRQPPPPWSKSQESTFLLEADAAPLPAKLRGPPVGARRMSEVAAAGGQFDGLGVEQARVSTGMAPLEEASPAPAAAPRWSALTLSSWYNCPRPGYISDFVWDTAVPPTSRILHSHPWVRYYANYELELIPDNLPYRYRTVVLVLYPEYSRIVHIDL